MTDRDIREKKTVEYFGTLFGVHIYTDPFDYDEQRELFIDRLNEVFGVPHHSDE